MSTLKVDSIVSENGGATTSINGFTPSVSNMAGRNRIINGDMRIDQRNAGASSNTGTSFLAYLTVDRWAVGANENLGTIQQVSDAPAGFVKSTKITVTGTTAAGSGNYGTFCQRVEGNNIADFGWGTSSAKTATISFWVKASISGIYAGYVYNNSYSYCYPFSYVVNATNTWEYKTITISAPTTGSFPTDTSYGIEVGFTLYAGSNYRGTANTWNTANYKIAPTGSIIYPFENNGMTIQWTGVQLEEGSVATPFEHRQYGQELALCQRYYWNIGPTLESFQGFVAVGSTGGDVYVRYPVPMRSAPAITYTSLSDYFVFIWNSSIGKTLTGITLLYANTIKGVLGINWSGASGTAGTGLSLDIKNTEVLQFSSEL